MNTWHFGVRAKLQEVVTTKSPAGVSLAGKYTKSKTQRNATTFRAEFDKYIRVFECISHKYLFGHSFVSIFLIQIYSVIRSYHICFYEYIRTLVPECKNLTNI